MFLWVRLVKSDFKLGHQQPDRVCNVRACGRAGARGRGCCQRAQRLLVHAVMLWMVEGQVTG
jgi:hypothetical protein